MHEDGDSGDPTDRFDQLLREAVRAPEVRVREPGQVVAERYRLDRHLGQGGMGSVWAATHQITLRQVALKFMLGPTERWDELEARFRREARAACAIEHPAVVPVHDVFELDTGELVMVMDLLEGETLAALLGRVGTLPPARTATLLLPVFAATRAAHAAGVIHRDLKPDNIFICSQAPAGEQVRVLDFGLARVRPPANAAVAVQDVETVPGSVLGTPSYMAPEQAAGDDVDHRADIWVLGAVLYECLAGKRAVDARSVGDAVEQLFSTGLTPLLQRAPGVPEDLATLSDGMLSIDPDDRPTLEHAVSVLDRFSTAT